MSKIVDELKKEYKKTKKSSLLVYRGGGKEQTQISPIVMIHLRN